MGVIKPGGPLVIKIGERVLFQHSRRRFILGQDAVGIGLYYLWHAHDEVGRVQPVIAQFIQPLRSSGGFLCPWIVGIFTGWNIGGCPSGNGNVSKVVEGV